MMEWAKESDEEQEVIIEEPETMDKQVERLLERNPRTPQRVVRRRKLTPQLTKGNTLDAAAKHEKSLPDLQAVDKNHAKQFVPLASTREHAFPPQNLHFRRKVSTKQWHRLQEKTRSIPPLNRRGMYRLGFDTETSTIQHKDVATCS